MIYHEVIVTSLSLKAIRSLGNVTRERIQGNRWRYSCCVALTHSLEKACEVYDHYQSRGFSVAITEARTAL